MFRSKSGLTIAERLDRLSIPVTECGCIVWLGMVKQHDYGQIGINRKTKLAHRVSWEQKFGKIPNGMHVLHKCDNPSCINPDHLFLGTHKQNMDDMVSKNRNAKGNTLPQTKLSPKSINEIRSSNLTGRELAKKFSISEGNISMIKSGKVWKHI